MGKERWSDHNAILGGLDPAAAGTGTTTTDVVDARYFDKVIFLISVGTVSASGTVDFTVYEGTATGTVTTKVGSITQLTAGDDNKQVVCEVPSSATTSGAYRYLKGVLKQGTANSTVQVDIIGANARYKPASDHDIASVDEIKVLS